MVDGTLAGQVNLKPHLREVECCSSFLVMSFKKFPNWKTSSLAIFALLVFPWGRFSLHSLFLSLLRLGRLVLLSLLRMLPIHMAKIPPRFNNIPHSPLKLLGLREATILSSIPENLCRSRLGFWGLMRYRDDKCAPCRGLKSNLAENS